MIEKTKEVRYDIYCKHCKYFGNSASTDPCNECLGTPSNGDSHVPVAFYKISPLINYLNEDPNVVGYVRDPAKSKNWGDLAPCQEPTEADIRKYFERGEDGDWWEIVQND